MKPLQRAIVFLQAAQEVIDQEARFLPSSESATEQYCDLRDASAAIDDAEQFLRKWGA